MSGPTFTRSRRSVRRARRRRTILVSLLALAAVAFAIGRFTGGEPEEPPIAQVAFQTTVRGDGAPRPDKAAAQAEGEIIAALFNDYYQRAFVDPESFSDEAYPEVVGRFSPTARDAFAADLNTLTIGEAAKEVKRVDPEVTTARITVYFEKGAPVLATAAVRFVGRARLLAKGADPVRIDQRATFHLRREGDAWQIAWYADASQTQRSFVPSPSPTAS